MTDGLPEMLTFPAQEPDPDARANFPCASCRRLALRRIGDVDDGAELTRYHGAPLGRYRCEGCGYVGSVYMRRLPP